MGMFLPTISAMALVVGVRSGSALLPLSRLVARHLSSASKAEAREVPVAIVGAGPTGLVLSSLLSAFGEAREQRRGALRYVAARRPGRIRPSRPLRPLLCQQQAPLLAAAPLPPGVRHVVLERGAGPTRHPQAHFINHRTMEVGRRRVAATLPTTVGPCYPARILAHSSTSSGCRREL